MPFESPGCGSRFRDKNQCGFRCIRTQFNLIYYCLWLSAVILLSSQVSQVSLRPNPNPQIQFPFRLPDFLKSALTPIQDLPAPRLPPQDKIDQGLEFGMQHRRVILPHLYTIGKSKNDNQDQGQHNSGTQSAQASINEPFFIALSHPIYPMQSLNPKELPYNIQQIVANEKFQQNFGHKIHATQFPPETTTATGTNSSVEIIKQHIVEVRDHLMKNPDIRVSDTNEIPEVMQNVNLQNILEVRHQVKPQKHIYEIRNNPNSQYPFEPAKISSTNIQDFQHPKIPVNIFYQNSNHEVPNIHLIEFTKSQTLEPPKMKQFLESIFPHIEQSQPLSPKQKSKPLPPRVQNFEFPKMEHFEQPPVQLHMSLQPKMKSVLPFENPHLAHNHAKPVFQSQFQFQGQPVKTITNAPLKFISNAPLNPNTQYLITLNQPDTQKIQMTPPSPNFPGIPPIQPQPQPNNIYLTMAAAIRRNQPPIPIPTTSMPNVQPSAPPSINQVLISNSILQTSTTPTTTTSTATTHIPKSDILSEQIAKILPHLPSSSPGNSMEIASSSSEIISQRVPGPGYQDQSMSSTLQIPQTKLTKKQFHYVSEKVPNLKNSFVTKILNEPTGTVTIKELGGSTNTSEYFWKTNLQGLPDKINQVMVPQIKSRLANSSDAKINSTKTSLDNQESTLVLRRHLDTFPLNLNAGLGNLGKRSGQGERLPIPKSDDDDDEDDYSDENDLIKTLSDFTKIELNKSSSTFTFSADKQPQPMLSRNHLRSLDMSLPSESMAINNIEKLTIKPELEITTTRIKLPEVTAPSPSANSSPDPILSSISEAVTSSPPEVKITTARIMLPEVFPMLRSSTVMNSDIVATNSPEPELSNTEIEISKVNPTILPNIEIESLPSSIAPAPALQFSSEIPFNEISSSTSAASADLISSSNIPEFLAETGIEVYYSPTPAVAVATDSGFSSSQATILAAATSTIPGFGNGSPEMVMSTSTTQMPGIAAGVQLIREILAEFMFKSSLLPTEIAETTSEATSPSTTEEYLSNISSKTEPVAEAESESPVLLGRGPALIQQLLSDLMSKTSSSSNTPELSGETTEEISSSTITHPTAAALERGHELIQKMLAEMRSKTAVTATAFTFPESMTVREDSAKSDEILFPVPTKFATVLRTKPVSLDSSFLNSVSLRIISDKSHHPELSEIPPTTKRHDLKLPSYVKEMHRIRSSNSGSIAELVDGDRDDMLDILPVYPAPSASIPIPTIENLLHLGNLKMGKTSNNQELSTSTSELPTPASDSNTDTEEATASNFRYGYSYDEPMDLYLPQIITPPMTTLATSTTTKTEPTFTSTTTTTLEPTSTSTTTTTVELTSTSTTTTTVEPTSTSTTTITVEPTSTPTTTTTVEPTSTSTTTTTEPTSTSTTTTTEPTSTSTTTTTEPTSTSTTTTTEQTSTSTTSTTEPTSTSTTTTTEPTSTSTTTITEPTSTSTTTTTEPTSTSTTTTTEPTSTSTTTTTESTSTTTITKEPTSSSTTSTPTITTTLEPTSTSTTTTTVEPISTSTTTLATTTTTTEPTSTYTSTKSPNKKTKTKFKHLAPRNNGGLSGLSVPISDDLPKSQPTARKSAPISTGPGGGRIKFPDQIMIRSTTTPGSTTTTTIRPIYKPGNGRFRIRKLLDYFIPLRIRTTTARPMKIRSTTWKPALDSGETDSTTTTTTTTTTVIPPGSKLNKPGIGVRLETVTNARREAKSTTTTTATTTVVPSTTITTDEPTTISTIPTVGDILSNQPDVDYDAPEENYFDDLPPLPLGSSSPSPSSPEASSMQIESGSSEQNTLLELPNPEISMKTEDKNLEVPHIQNKDEKAPATDSSGETSEDSNSDSAENLSEVEKDESEIAQSNTDYLLDYEENISDNKFRPIPTSNLTNDKIAPSVNSAPSLPGIGDSYEGYDDLPPAPNESVEEEDHVIAPDISIEQEKSIIVQTAPTSVPTLNIGGPSEPILPIDYDVSSNSDSNETPNRNPQSQPTSPSSFIPTSKATLPPTSISNLTTTTSPHAPKYSLTTTSPSITAESASQATTATETTMPPIFKLIPSTSTQKPITLDTVKRVMKEMSIVHKSPPRYSSLTMEITRPETPTKKPTKSNEEWLREVALKALDRGIAFQQVFSINIGKLLLRRTALVDIDYMDNSTTFWVSDTDNSTIALPGTGDGVSAVTAAVLIPAIEEPESESPLSHPGTDITKTMVVFPESQLQSNQQNVQLNRFSPDGGRDSDTDADKLIPNRYPSVMPIPLMTNEFKPNFVYSMAIERNTPMELTPDYAPPPVAIEPEIPFYSGQNFLSSASSLGYGLPSQVLPEEEEFEDALQFRATRNSARSVKLKMLRRRRNF